MLTYRESVQRFQELRAQVGIPPDADFFSVEKRHIEQLPSGEIEGEDTDEGPALDPEAGEPGVTSRLAWVAEFTLGFMFWELAIDSRGGLVRLRKSR